MSVAIKTYHSVKEITDTVDKEITNTKSNLGSYLRKLDETRTLAEKSKKIRDVVMKLANKKNGNSESLGEIDVGSMKVVLEADALHELTAIEDAVRSHQEYLLVLQKVRESLKPLDQLGDTEGLEFIIVENNKVPERILLKSK
ncbi:MAG TPA: hypothetical protein VK253_01985 [Candidatus Binatia bacterium]|nr:hypothetical protein [Candidatus Binatia bacterium]